MRKKKSWNTEACRGERLGLSVMIVSHTRDERGLQPNLKIEKSIFFFQERKCFYTQCVIKLWNSLARWLRLDLFLNYYKDCFDAFPLFSSFYCLSPHSPKSKVFCCFVLFLWKLFSCTFSSLWEQNAKQHLLSCYLLFFKFQKLFKKIHRLGSVIIFHQYSDRHVFI